MTAKLSVIDASAVLRRAAKLRRRFLGKISEAELSAAKRSGRA